MFSINPIQTAKRLSIAGTIATSWLLFGTSVHAAEGAQVVPLKSGWSEQALSSFANGCVLAIVTPAKRDYYARASEKGNKTPRPFPEPEVTASVQPMCSCIGLRIAQSSDLQELSLNMEAIAKPFIEEAMGGGQCKPDGLLGAMLEQRARK